MNAARELSGSVGVRAASAAMGIDRTTYYRKQTAKVLAQSVILSRPKPSLTLTDQERYDVLEALSSQRFVDKAPAEIYAIHVSEKQKSEKNGQKLQ